MTPSEAFADRAAADEEIARLRDQHLRLRADLDNILRRSTRERELAREEGRRDALLPMLPVFDALERALANGSMDPEFYEGVSAIHRLFLKALHDAGAEPVDSIGHPFDPNVHEAVGTVPADDVEPGTVVREVRRGWRIGKELLRPAQVQVAGAVETVDPWQ
jgi:molecular chaperone GrpE